jgi:hypothetical protein
MTNVITQLRDLLSAERTSEVALLYRELSDNRHVRHHELEPTIEQFRLYLARLLEGFEYAERIYGEDALPGKLKFYADECAEKHSRPHDFIFYSPLTDEVGVSYFHIACEAQDIKATAVWMGDKHLTGVVVRAGDHAMLQAVEEAYHRVQCMRFPFEAESTVNNDQHWMEREIGPVWQRAITELRVETRVFPQEENPHWATR